MKIITLNPPFLPMYSRQSRSPCVTKGGTFYYPYFLAYATGALEKAGFEVKLIDAVARNWTHEQTVDFCKKENPDLIIIDTSTPSILNDIKISDELKKELPNTHINMVGTFPTHLPEWVLKRSKLIDSICRDEYDYTVVVLAKTLELKKNLKNIDGLSFRENKKIIHNKLRKRIENLDNIPFVSEVYKKHLNINDYFYASLKYPQITLLTARGCPYNCAFCNSPFKSSYRFRSVKNVVEELKWIQENLPEVKEVMIEDETFPANKKRTMELCNLMIKENIKLTWSCNARVNTDFETLAKMKEAGCRLMCVGFESPSQKVLDSIHKGTTKNLQLEFMKKTRSAKLLVNGCFILGLPNDTEESIMETIKFSIELNPDTIQVYPIFVYPGTEAYKWAKDNKYLETEDYSKWLTKDGQLISTISRPGMSSKDLEKYCNIARKKFYLRPKYILMKLIQAIKNPEEGMRTLKSAKIFFKHLT